MGDQNIQTMQGDCLELMKLIPDGSVDMILCDLPYGSTSCAWDVVIPFEPLWEQYRRLIKPNGAIVLTSAGKFTPLLQMSNFDWFKYCWYWQKSRPSDFVNAKNKPLRDVEECCVFSPGVTANNSPRRMIYIPQGLVHSPKREFRPNPKMRKGSAITDRPSHVKSYDREFTNYPRSILSFANPNQGTIHPTQKPVDLFAYLIRTYTNPCDLVLDSCAGSMTTAVACIQEGRRAIVIEKDPEIYAKGIERLRALRQ
ncbi:methyltransferase [Capsulimonas corticalis]|uniref:Methyltransferase n=1 Tax=Capsulimonas corticalis TaxID=2219043 RepID=A0A402CNN4_9BACT|nr:DNA methyltransferase [Capsulimonas corticalis]BDI33374.1 methyltransferase [Capsulimonas corticalis]